MRASAATQQQGATPAGRARAHVWHATASIRQARTELERGRGDHREIIRMLEDAQRRFSAAIDLLEELAHA